MSFGHSGKKKKFEKINRKIKPKGQADIWTDTVNRRFTCTIKWISKKIGVKTYAKTKIKKWLNDYVASKNVTTFTIARHLGKKDTAEL